MTRPLSQLTINELQSLQQSLRKSSAGITLAERDQINRICQSINGPALGDHSLLSVEQIADKMRAEQSLHEFAKQAWHVLEPGVPFIDNWHLRVLCDHLDALWKGTIENLIVNVPPGTSKSRFCCVMFPAWIWIHDPSQKFMCASYSGVFTLEDSLRCRQLIESSWYQARWGSHFQFLSDQNSKLKFENNKRGWRVAITTSSGTGRHPDILICDDPNNSTKSGSKADREHINEAWWDGAMVTRGRIKKARRLIIQQRVHPLDLSGYIMSKSENGGDALTLKKPGAWQHLRLPMVFEEELKCKTPIFEDFRRDGELLWPEAFSQQMVDAMRLEMGSQVFGSQLQQRPTPKGGSLFHSEWLQVIDPPLQQWLAPIFRSGFAPGVQNDHEVFSENP